MQAKTDVSNMSPEAGLAFSIKIVKMLGPGLPDKLFENLSFIQLKALNDYLSKAQGGSGEDDSKNPPKVGAVN